jgi:DnaK suppressor protein
MMALSDKKINEFKEILLELKFQLENSLKETSSDVKSSEDISGYTQHQADIGTDTFDKTVSVELSNEELKIYKQINRALAKIDEKTYGVCDISGKDIPVKRLSAIPYATMTVDSQEKVERGEVLNEFL